MPTKKVDNHARHGWRVKVEIRRRVLEALTPAKTIVFDAFAGQGLMWLEVWKDAAGYVGCDERWHNDERCCYVADNRRVLRGIELSHFTCFDLDAFDSPWEQAIIIAARRPRLARGERIGLVLSDGTSTRSGNWPPALRQATGIKRSAADVGAVQLHDELIARAVLRLVRQMGGRIMRQWTAVAKPRFRYLGLIIEGAPSAPSAPCSDSNS
jgi:hypothetical protein